MVTNSWLPRGFCFIVVYVPLRRGHLYNVSSTMKDPLGLGILLFPSGLFCCCISAVVESHSFSFFVPSFLSSLSKKLLQQHDKGQRALPTQSSMILWFFRGRQRPTLRENKRTTKVVKENSSLRRILVPVWRSVFSPKDSFSAGLVVIQLGSLVSFFFFFFRNMEERTTESDN